MTSLSEKEIKFAYDFLSDRESYHHHKEQMAYIGFVIVAGWFTAIMTFNWESIRLVTTNTGGNYILLLAFFIIWIVFHLFIRWQLRYRRLAARQVATLLSVILEDLRHQGRAEAERGKTVDASADNDKRLNAEKSERQILNTILDYLIPRSSAAVSSDVDISAYPQWYQKKFKDTAERVGAGLGEHLVTWGSLIIFLITILRFTLLWDS